MDRLLIAVVLTIAGLGAGCSTGTGGSAGSGQATSNFPTPELVTDSQTTESGELKTSLAATTPTFYPMTASRAVADKGGAWIVAAPVTVAYDVLAGTVGTAARGVGAVLKDTIEHPVRNPAIGLASYFGAAYFGGLAPFDDDDDDGPRREPTTFTANGQQLDATAGGFDECRFLEERHESGSGKTEIECKRHED